MAAISASLSGFSYAQAAKGRSPVTISQAQTPASKLTSGAATPATGTLSELGSGGNWADDVEATVAEKQPAESQKSSQDSAKSVELSSKESSVERAKSEDKMEASGVSSPDLTASGSTTTKDDDSSTAPTNGGSSETTWETKSQASEPAWIVDRKERQASSQKSDGTVKVEKKSKEISSPSPPKPVLQEAPPPPVNIWQKRAAEQKVTAVVAQPPTLKNATNAPPASPATLKENQRPRADSRKKAMSVGNIPRIGEPSFDVNSEPRKPIKGANVVRINSLQQGSKPAAETATTPSTRAGIPTRSSLPNIPNAPSFAKDEGSWPTPELAQDLERKDLAEKETLEKHAEDATPSAKGRKKPEWAKLAVTPTIRWESQNARGAEGQRPPGAERSGRSGVRGRGGFRGGANGVNGSARPPQRGSVSHGEDEGNAAASQRGRSDMTDREAIPPPPKPNRASSESSRRGQNVEPRPDRSSRGQIFTDVRPDAGNTRPVSRQSEGSTATSSWVETQSAMPRTKSPHHVDSATSNTKDEIRMPEPILRRSSVATQTENRDPLANTARDGPPIRMVPSESRKEQRAFDAYKEPNINGLSRGAKRNGRGRGGAREFANAHQGSHAFPNGDVAGSPAFGVPPSPSAYHSAGGNHFTYPSQGGRGGWSRGNPRSHSISIEGYYGRYSQPYGPSQPPPGQAYMPGIYDLNGYPMSAMPYQPYMDQQYLLAMVNMQLEYYFSIDNLLKDIFLRKNMDSQGFVFLDVVASFNRMKQLTQDRNLLKGVCLASETIEIREGEDGKERLRRRDGYEQFLLPIDQREPGAQNDGPKQLHPPERSQMQAFGAMPSRGPVLPGMQPRHDRRSYDGGYPVVNGAPPPFAAFPAVPEAAYAEMANGEDTRGRAAISPTHHEHASPSMQRALSVEKDAEPDAFPDEQVASHLTVMVSVMKNPPFHTGATRTFSNGSIDSRSIFAELDKSTGGQTTPMTNDDGATNGDGPSHHVDLSKAHSTTRNPAPKIYWVKEQVARPESLSSDITHKPYTEFRLKALEQRNHAATGTCPYDLNVLYKFWSHFLLRNFNSKMYQEFKYYANEDGRTRHNLEGLYDLTKFYDQALHSHTPIRDRVVKDYVELVNNEPANLEGAAFKQLRSAWRDGALNLKNRKKLVDVVSSVLKARLDEDVASSS